MFKAKAFSTVSPASPLAPSVIVRRDPNENDVQIEILFCSICHSDLHMARNEWSSIMATVHPCVPGHEIVGRGMKVRSGVTKFKAGEVGNTVQVAADRGIGEVAATQLLKHELT